MRWLTCGASARGGLTMPTLWPPVVSAKQMSARASEWIL
jgi:hypothetical protein